ncbi:hypothetical protein V5F34_07285 [Xanthobacter autotrophicus]|uniref:hypothetical protein n=1 Tax=Xanthobacter autotrophicus TaxID=280 RepID=UPI003728BC15
MEKIIKIKHMGNIGNRMFQYMFAKTLQMKIKKSIVVGYDIPEWNLVCKSNVEIPEKHIVVSGHNINIEYIAYLMNSDIIDGVICNVWGMRMEYYLNSDIFRSMFFSSNENKIGFGCNDLVINIRSAEIIRGLHNDYTPLQFEFYRHIITKTGLKPIFMGQTSGSDPYCTALREEFNFATFLDSDGAENDFHTMMNSKNIVMSVSSFSWLACWFSRDSIIHMPVSGIFNPKQRKDVNLLPVDDCRYKFYYFDPKKWRGTDAEIESLIRSDAEFYDITTDDVKILVSQNVGF